MGFTLIELLLALAVSLVLLMLAVPAFSQMVQRSRSDSDQRTLVEALSYGRLTAISGGSAVRIQPARSDLGWSHGLSIDTPSTEPANVLRVVPAISRGAKLVLPSGVDSIEFNTLGGLVGSRPLSMTYGLGNQSRTITLCLSGRIAPDGDCG